MPVNQARSPVKVASSPVGPTATIGNPPLGPYMAATFSSPHRRGSNTSVNTLFTVATRGTSTNYDYITWHNSNSEGFLYGFATNDNIGFLDGAVYPLTGGDNTQALGYFRLNGSNYDVGRDGGTASTLGGNRGAIVAEEIARSNGSNQITYMQEFVLYGTDQSTNRTGIETNIDTYFSIT